MSYFIGVDGVKYWQGEKQNRNATLESLEAVVKMILADNEEDFCKYYSLATHDCAKGGHTVWYYMHNEPGYTRKYSKEYYEKNKEKYKKYYEEKKALKEKINKEVFNFE